ncbi:hypothetical protein AB0E63_24325 [Kribbella sp. NPDC026596]|uniref:hypothetical protein n=1 Tax=Kribbella sp. NPDC026596 TaxID=3155122 RepID=UPI0033FAE516
MRRSLSCKTLFKISYRSTYQTAHANLGNGRPAPRFCTTPPEGNQIAKAAETGAWVPAGSGIRALDEDGTACSSDYYLRLTNDGGRMFKGQAPLTETRPTAPMPA